MIFHVNILTHWTALLFTNYELGCFKPVWQTGVGQGKQWFNYLQKMGFSLYHNVQTGSGAHWTLQTLCLGAVYPQTKKVELKPTNQPDLLLRLSMLIYNSLLHCISMAWSLPNHKANYIFDLLISSCRWSVQSVETALQMMCQHKSHSSQSS